MSATAIQAVSNRLKQALVDAVGVPVELADPTGPAADGLSVWLYQVTADEFARNAPAGAAEANGRLTRFRRAPLPVNLHYLVTPLNPTPAAAQETLGKVLLALHDQPALEVDDPDVSQTVRVSLAADHLDDRAKLWEALGKPYRLSVCYTVRTVRLVSAELTSDRPVGATRLRGDELPPPPRPGD